MDYSVTENCISRKINIFIVGLRGSGKTSVLYNLNIGDISNIETTEDFCGNVTSTASNDHVNVLTWDLSSCRNPSIVLDKYTHKDVVLLVVDCTERRHNSLMMLQSLHTEFRDSIVAVLANKQDVPGAMTVDECYEMVNGNKLIPKNSSIRIFPVISVANGSGLQEVESWVSYQLTKKQIVNSVFGAQKNDILRTNNARRKNKTSSFKKTFSRWFSLTSKSLVTQI